MGGGSGGGGRGGRSGGGGGGSIDSRVEAIASDFTAVDKYGREVKPYVWRKDGKERVYVPELQKKQKYAGYITKGPDYAYDNFKSAFPYKGWKVIPDGKGSTGQMKRFVDALER